MELNQKELNRLTIQQIAEKHNLTISKASIIKRYGIVRVTLRDIVKHAIAGKPIDDLPDTPSKTMKLIYQFQSHRFTYELFVETLRYLVAFDYDAIKTKKKFKKISFKNIKRWQTALQSLA
jgi:hypothetical protein